MNCYIKRYSVVTRVALGVISLISVREMRENAQASVVTAPVVVSDIELTVPSPFELRTISSRPDTVSGGDVVVQLGTPQSSRWKAQLNGRDVTPLFRPVQGSDNLRALLAGLKLGKNALELRVDGTVRSRLELVDHPLAGPIFSGPHLRPFICQTVANGLEPAIDSDCQAKTVVQYYYKSKETNPASDWAPAAPSESLSPGFKVYDSSGPPPADVAQIAAADGRVINYIVRREIGTLNRAVYDIQFLHQPGQPLPTPWSRPTPGWNGRLVVLFPAGCASGHLQGKFLELPGRGQEPLLTQGYAVATTTFNLMCNDKVSAETLSMVKEHFTKQYGAPVHTIGWGGSGGAMQMHLVAQNYPGLLDGIIASGSFPDIISELPSMGDCLLLGHAFETSSQRWTEPEKTVVSGFATWRTCANQSQEGRTLIYPELCDDPWMIPKELLYDPIGNPKGLNPKGLRCDIYDDEINVLGRNPRTGFARRPMDNVGVQYGLLAFNGGRIDAEHFVELNERIGGYDEDGRFSATRGEADSEALRIAYERGLVLTGGGGLGQIPIIDWRQYSDDLADEHNLVWSFATRARLIAANGNADNQVMLLYPRFDVVPLWKALQGNWDALSVHQKRDLLPQMDRWLDGIAADNGSGSLPAKVARNKPADLTDGCYTTDGERVVEPASYDGRGRCNQLYPPHANPRIAAGGPLTHDVLKCSLKPLTPAEYSRALSPEQLRRLKAIFPSGVCDYSRPGIRQPITQTTGQSHAARTPDYQRGLTTAASVSEVSIPNTHRINFISKVNGHRYSMNVALPFGPVPSKGYGVLYVLDGNSFFDSATEASRLNARDVAVVGIGYPDDSAFVQSVVARRGPVPDAYKPLPPSTIASGLERLYDLTLPASDEELAAQRWPGDPPQKGENVGGLDDFLKTIETEVKPRVASLARIDFANQALFGHSLGGLAVLHALFVEPTAFRTFIIASPSIWWNHKAVLADFPRFTVAINSGEASPRILVTVGAEESTLPKSIPASWGPHLDPAAVEANLRQARMIENGAELVARLKALHGKESYVVGDYAIFDHQGHTISPWPALGRAIPFAFPAPQ